MKAYVVFDDVPEDWSNHASIISVHKTLTSAKLAILRLQKKDAYWNQYLRVIAYTIKP